MDPNHIPHHAGDNPSAFSHDPLLVSLTPQAAALSDVVTLPGCVTWLELQYHRLLEAAIARLSGSSVRSPEAQLSSGRV